MEGQYFAELLKVSRTLSFLFIAVLMLTKFIQGAYNSGKPGKLGIF